MYVYRGIAVELRRLGVEHIFALPGEDVIKTLVEAEALGISVHIARHENQAVAMADSYSRSTDRLGVVALTGGPGFTNALTALNTAHRFGSKVLLLIGGEHPGHKYVPHPAVCSSLGIQCITPVSAEGIVPAFREAISGAHEGRLVVFEVPIPLFDAEIGEVSKLEESRKAQRTGLNPDRDAVGRIVDLLKEGWAVSRPLILAGRGAVISDAGLVLRELGEHIGALMGTTLRGHGLFAEDPEDPFNIGIVGTYSHSVAAGLLASVDWVLAFGASMNRYTTFDGELFPKARVIQINTDASVLDGSGVEEELSVVGDAKTVGEWIVSALRGQTERSIGFRSEAVRAEIAAFDPRSEFVDQSKVGAVDPRTVALSLDGAMPEDRIVVVDGGHNSSFAIPFLRFAHHKDFVQTSYVGGVGAIGLGLGAAIGAAIGGHPRPVLLWMGDVSFMMSLGDLETAIRHKLPIVVMVINDRALGAEVKFLELMNMPTSIVEVETPSLADVAASLGAEGFTVDSLDDLGVLAERLRNPLDGPLVVDCYVSTKLRADWVDFMWARSS